MNLRMMREDINSLPELTENVRLFKDDVEKMRLETLFGRV